MADIKKIARERIVYLFLKAADAFSNKRPDLAKRYVHIAREVGMKSQVSIPRELKRSFCKACGTYWVSGSTVRVRTQKKEKRITYSCLVCGAVRRLPFYKKK